MRKLFHDLGYPQRTLDVLGDNQAALALTRSPLLSARAKHIDIHHHFLRDRVSLGQVKFQYISTDRNVVDCLTKGLSTQLHITCLKGMGMR